ncbi:hypothetical protein AC482_00640 [miscellaneous Crenarchaeota group-15 archaeon DG-45]|uniref:DUF2085 domain-containing protein n=1 Tax=miscellaneous Crenarchaeota group-15 archaeon DG-45 TaxID=1685127 RepID=A0A0M0BSZ1_9ARCH|nr:MAG: hypothetical protein AC482_00640 [miscellaneous Crenarchaeota group-15 archaeon DG-45]
MVLVAALLHRPPPRPSVDASLHIWVLFSTLIVLGASATLFPHICGRAAVRAEALDPSRTSTLLGVRAVHGHHPLCGGFQGHELAIGGKTFCAGCVGLLAGAASALVGATLHFVYGFTYPPPAPYIGLGLVALGLIHVPALRTNRPILRSFLNAGFVTGFALILVGANEVGGPGLALMVIGMNIFWMFTRVQLSNWDHEKICLSCGYRCLAEKRGPDA